MELWLTSTLRHILGTSNALSFSAGTWLTGQLPLHVLVCPRRTLNTLPLLPTVKCPHTTAHWRKTQKLMNPVQQHQDTSRNFKRTTFSIMEYLSRAAGLSPLRQMGWFLSYFIICSWKLDVELLLVDGLPKCPHGTLQLLLHLLTHTINVASIYNILRGLF